METRFIIHDAAAKEVDEKTFFSTSESGGTLISSAYKLCKKLIDEDYPLSEWNVYPFHFSDGDNWSGQDTRLCVKLLKEYCFPNVNMFGYGQVEQVRQRAILKRFGESLSQRISVSLFRASKIATRSSRASKIFWARGDKAWPT